MSTAWTGGQYSVLRALLGAYLAAHYARLLPVGAELFSDVGMLPDAGASPLVRVFPNVLALFDGPAAVTALLALAVALAVLLAVGLADRAAALGLWYVGACLVGRNPLVLDPALSYLGLVLVVHAFLPAAPFGAVAARGRADPGGGWSFPRAWARAVWFVLGAGYAADGLAKLASASWRDGSALARLLAGPHLRPGAARELLAGLPDDYLQAATWAVVAVELAFVPLALVRALRPLAWGSMLAVHFAAMVVTEAPGLPVAMVLVHLYAFDPRWIAARRAPLPETVYYDGDCGLCHRTVRFLLAEDPGGVAFRFAPLASESFARDVPEERRAALPDSVVLRSLEGELFTRSEAVLRMLAALGGLWGLLARAGRLAPRALRDAAYDGIAAVRKRVFARPSDACPLHPPHLAGRFLQ